MRSTLDTQQPGPTQDTWAEQKVNWITVDPGNRFQADVPMPHGSHFYPGGTVLVDLTGL
jgi:hypothetical protein